MPHHFISPEPSDCRCFLVPFIDLSIDVNAKDGGIGRVDQLLQVLRHCFQLFLCHFAFRDILPHSDNPHNVPTGITTCGRIQKDVDAVTGLGVQRELEITCFPSSKSIFKHHLNGILKFIADEIFHQASPHHFIFAKTSDLNSLLVPFIYLSLNVDTKNGSISRVNQLAEIRGHSGHLHLCSFLLSDVLPNTNNPHKFPSRVNPWGGIQENFYRFSTFRVQGKLKISCCTSSQCICQYHLHRLLEIGTDEL
mmetsp:Transcript_95828/g.165158  ORF Transcript_95828/g.165158 Transcript_95828/m.165158 type:complete len:251 (+) Transcript_95828:246-998(+)